MHYSRRTLRVRKIMSDVGEREQQATNEKKRKEKRGARLNV